MLTQVWWRLWRSWVFVWRRLSWKWTFVLCSVSSVPAFSATFPVWCKWSPKKSRRRWRETGESCKTPTRDRSSRTLRSKWSSKEIPCLVPLSVPFPLGVRQTGRWWCTWPSCSPPTTPTASTPTGGFCPERSLRTPRSRFWAKTTRSRTRKIPELCDVGDSGSRRQDTQSRLKEHLQVCHT